MIILVNDDEAWIICTWLDDYFDDDSVPVYILETMIVFIWINYMRIWYVGDEYVYWRCERWWYIIWQGEMEQWIMY